MINLRSVYNNSVARLQGGEVDVTPIASAIAGDHRINELEKLELTAIELLLVSAIYTDEAEPLKKKVLELKGKDYAQQLERARLAAWQGLVSKDYGTIKGIQALLEEHKDCALREWHLNDCRSVEEMKVKLDLYDQLSKGNLPGFYARGVDVIEVGNYKIKLQSGSWENVGGVELHVVGNDKSIMQVGGKIHRYTDIRSIHGGEKAEDAIAEFRKSTGIHPANLDLLLFLKLSQYLGHEKLTMAARASRAFNNRDIDSSLYLIPRNYFRLSENPESGLYEFDGSMRDGLLEKFVKKNETVANAVTLMSAYLDKQQ